MSQTTIRDALQKAQQQLTALPEVDPRLEAEILLSFSLNKQRSYLYTWPDKPVNPSQLSHFSDLLTRRLQGEPIAYITGHKEFWSLDLNVTPDTLIPRPETELLIELALELIPVHQPFSVADLGTGSGAIAAALASERPNACITATDISTATLSIASSNFKHLNLANIHTCAGSWCEAFTPNQIFDLIVSNPPYIPENDHHLKQGDLPWEPRAALASGKDGLDDIRQIIQQSPNHLRADGWLLLEHGYDQGAEVRQLLQDQGFKQVSTHRDLAGHDRLSKGQR